TSPTSRWTSTPPPGATCGSACRANTPTPTATSASRKCSCSRQSPSRRRWGWWRWACRRYCGVGGEGLRPRAAAGELELVQRPRLDRDAVAMFTRREVPPPADHHRRHRPHDRGVPQHVVRAGRLLDPPRPEPRQHLHVLDRLVHLPILVRIDHQHAPVPDLLPDDRAPPHVVIDVPADL